MLCDVLLSWSEMQWWVESEQTTLGQIQTEYVLFEISFSWGSAFDAV